MHRLSEKWVLWAHLPQETNWNMESYLSVMTITYVEEMLSLIHTLPEKLITDCMFFLMKENITPTWEDAHNKHGGCFSYKINHHIQQTWRDVSYSLIGNTLSADASFQKDITGISISPKKNFCILKVWMGSCVHRDPSKITLIKPEGCIFKKH
jgi:translation initiation factor 4E